NATLLEDGSWSLSHLLRGLIGTEEAMFAGAAAGARIVLLDSAVQPIALTTLENGLALNWLAGPAHLPVTSDAQTQILHQHEPLSLRPLSPVHLTGRRTEEGCHFSWIRRSRIGADDWAAAEIPLGESSEA